MLQMRAIRASGGARADVYNAGFDFPEGTAGRHSYIYRDGFQGCRGNATGGPDAEWDIGAHEYGATVCTLGGTVGGGTRSLGVGGSGSFN